MDPVVLYILARTDAKSMRESAGLTAAQVAHAANQMVATISEKFKPLLLEWENETKMGFGTTIVLETDGDTMYSRIEYALNNGFHAGIVHDPTFPLFDGDILHLVPFDTCAFLLCRKSHKIVDDLPRR